jgi:cobalt-zinc-cadmium resistance protein CzcA
VLIVRTITDLRLAGLELEDAIQRGSIRCLRPILIDAMVAILGLVPASLATGLGSDVQRPLATVIVWVLFSTTVMTLLLIPVLYRLIVPRLPAPAADEEKWPAI